MFRFRFRICFGFEYVSVTNMFRFRPSNIPGLWQGWTQGQSGCRSLHRRRTIFDPSRKKRKEKHHRSTQGPRDPCTLPALNRSFFYESILKCNFFTKLYKSKLSLWAVESFCFYESIFLYFYQQYKCVSKNCLPKKNVRFVKKLIALMVKLFVKALKASEIFLMKRNLKIQWKPLNPNPG